MTSAVLDCLREHETHRRERLERELRADGLKGNNLENGLALGDCVHADPQYGATAGMILYWIQQRWPDVTEGEVNTAVEEGVSRGLSQRKVFKSYDLLSPRRKDWEPVLERDEAREGEEYVYRLALVGMPESKTPARRAADSPSDLITRAVACQRYAVSGATLKRSVKDESNPLKSYRPASTPRNGPHRFSEADVAARWPKR